MRNLRWPPPRRESGSQLNRYRHLNRQEAGLEIRSLVKTMVPQVQFHRYAARTERHFRRLFAAIRAYLDDLDRGDFVYRPGLGCSMCDYRNSHCQQWCGWSGCRQ